MSSVSQTQISVVRCHTKQQCVKYQWVISRFFKLIPQKYATIFWLILRRSGSDYWHFRLISMLGRFDKKLGFPNSDWIFVERHHRGKVNIQIRMNPMSSRPQPRRASLHTRVISFMRRRNINRVTWSSPMIRCLFGIRTSHKSIILLFKQSEAQQSPGQILWCMLCPISLKPRTQLQHMRFQLHLLSCASIPINLNGRRSTNNSFARRVKII